jgi:bifunctional DNA-binding transcriptional regulator/antitoxin component of YhaV-PrlF toxin-antitoxin module
MSIIAIDNKNRIRIPKKLSRMAGINPGDKVLVFATINQVVIIPLKNKKFVGSLDGIDFKEEDHEASKLIFGGERNQNASD